MANMNAMGGPVRDAPMAMMNNCAVAPHGAPRQRRENDKKRTQLNTYIYEYFLCYGMLDCAYAILNADSGVKVQKHSPGSPHDDKGGWLRNALPDESIETGLDSKRLELLPAPNVPNVSLEGCFLYEWFCLFWDMFNAQKDECEGSEVNQYASYTQQNKLTSNTSCLQAEGSSLLPHPLGGTTLNTFYNPSEMGEGDMTHGTSGGEAGGRSHRDLQGHQMQAMQLTSMEQQNKELIARHDTSGLRRDEGVPRGRGGQGSPRGPQRFQQPALQGGAAGASPNAANPMNRGTQQVNISANQINPNLEPHIFKASIGGINGNMTTVQTNGWTESHSSHPNQQFNGQTIWQQVAATQPRCQQQVPTSQNSLIQLEGDPNGNQIPQAALGRVQGTPQQRSMAPSSASAEANDSAKSRSTIPSPPQTTKAASPTPSQSGKGDPKKGTAPKKGTKNIKSKTAIQKTSKSNLSSGATPAAKISPCSVPPVNPVNLKKEAQNAGPAQVVPTGQPAAPLPLALAPKVALPHDDLTQNMTFSMDNPDMTDFGYMDFTSLSAADDGLHDFDFDSFLQISADETGGSHLNYVPFDMDTGEIDRD